MLYRGGKLRLDVPAERRVAVGCSAWGAGVSTGRCRSGSQASLRASPWVRPRASLRKRQVGAQLALTIDFDARGMGQRLPLRRRRRLARDALPEGLPWCRFGFSGDFHMPSLLACEPSATSNRRARDRPLRENDEAILTRLQVPVLSTLQCAPRCTSMEAFTQAFADSSTFLPQSWGCCRRPCSTVERAGSGLNGATCFLAACLRGHGRPRSTCAQNRKYRCAIGSSVAGSQVSNWPSARTS